MLLFNLAAKSQAEYSNHDIPGAANGRTHWSICMDGTDVDFSKYMASAFHWCAIGMAC